MITQDNHLTRWLIKERVLVATVSNEYESEDAFAGIRQVGEFLKMGVMPVHLIVDMRGVQKFTTNFREPMQAISEAR